MRRSIYFALVLLLVGLAWPLMQLRSDVRELASDLRTIARSIVERTIPMGDPYTTTWTSAGPMSQLVTTTQKVDETPEQCAARHAARVAALKAQFPQI